MLTGLLPRLRQRLADRADSEHEQAFTRFVVVPGMLVYMLWAPQPPERAGFVLAATIVIFALGMTAATAIIAHILWRPQVSPARRVAGMIVDVSGVGASMMVGGVSASAFFPLLLWIILGHGFRYGRPYLIAAAGTSAVTFGLVLAFSPDWRAMPYIGAGLLLALFMLPAYFAVLLTKLKRAIEKAEEASRAKSHFVAAVSHEFRTPLNAVIGMSELLRTTRLSPDQGDMVATIRAAATGLLGLVNNVLDLAKLEARRFTVEDTPYDLHQVLATVRHILFHQARSKGLHLRLRLAPEVPYRLRGDGRALQQVLLNLAGNAVKFTERGGVVIDLGLIGLRPGPLRLRIEVRDTGLGLSPAAQARIFERFAQADETRRKVIGGTGLGLSIARELVELMGGTIGVTSKQGVGSCFWVELPLQPAAETCSFDEPQRGQVIVLGSRNPATAVVGRLDRLGFKGRAVASVETALQLLRGDSPARVVVVTGHEPPVDIDYLAGELARLGGAEPIDLITLGAGRGDLPDLTLADLPANVDDAIFLACLRAALQAPAGAKPPDEEARVHAPARRLNVLVAEDNRTNQKVISRLLQHAGHEVTVASDGQGAVDALDQGRFDIVLMDINMPDMDGIETVKLLRFMHPPESLPPIVALSADATPETQAACREIGFSGYLLKPIDTNALLRTLDELTGGPVAAAAQPREEPARRRAAAEAAQAPEPPVLEPAKLASIARLDTGDGFLTQVIDDFLSDAAAIIDRIEVAILSGDARSVRDEAHALRSSAGYIGASALFALCLAWRGLDDDALILRGRAEIARLRHEFARLSAALKAARSAGARATAAGQRGAG